VEQAKELVSLPCAHNLPPINAMSLFAGYKMKLALCHPRSISVVDVEAEKLCFLYSVKMLDRPEFSQISSSRLVDLSLVSDRHLIVSTADQNYISINLIDPNEQQLNLIGSTN
jgi:hypothetical protein